MLRSTVLFCALLCVVLSCSAQYAQLSADTIRAKLAGCWYADDGGTKGEYCFQGEDQLVITPFGRGREKLEREWTVDKKGNVVVRSGGHSISYLVERLAADGFILVTAKGGVRLEGHKDKPKR